MQHHELLHSNPTALTRPEALRCLIRLYSFFFGPTLSSTLSRPAGRERELTAIFDLVFKALKYPLDKHVEKEII